MGKRGPKPKPTALRVFEGDPGRLLQRRVGEVQPPIDAEAPPSPAWLGEIGRHVWDSIAPHLHAIGCLTKADSKLLSLYCEAWDELFAARAVIDKEGLVLVNDKGTTYAHPAVGIKNRAVLRIKGIGGEFGMSPSSRVGLNLGTQSKANSLAEFKKHG